MKIALFFGRGRQSRRPQPARSIELTRDWTTRDWADLPVHHPRRD